MASLSKCDNGTWRMLFQLPDGTRREIRLGRMDSDAALTFKKNLESLLVYRESNQTESGELAKWIVGLPDRFHERLATFNLVSPRAKAKIQTGSTLGVFLSEFFANVPVKESTRVTYDQTKRVLIEHFGADKNLAEIGTEDADRWREWLQNKGLAQATIARRVKCARQAFKRAVRWKRITDNPFIDVHTGSQSNKARQYYLSREDAQKVLDACPDAQWRLIVALSRFGGLRCPSEHLALKWTDILWDKSRIRVPSCKTEHLEDGDCRYMPIFPELEPHLLAVYSEPSDSEYVITRYRDAKQNLRTQLKRIIAKAGLKPWPRLFHNLRATRQTELSDRFPAHVVAAWLGNTGAVAMEHYLMATDAHFEAAIRGPVNCTQNRTRSGSVSTVNDNSMPESENTQCLLQPIVADRNLLEPVTSMTPAGFEPALSA